MYSLLLIAWVAGSQFPVGAMVSTSKGVMNDAPHPRAPTRPPWGDPNVHQGTSDNSRGEKARCEKPAPNMEGVSNFKKRVRKEAWQWMGMQTLPTGQAGSQPPPPSFWTREVGANMKHRHRRDIPERPSRGGSELQCWSWNVNTLQLGQLQESLRTASGQGVQVLMLQSTRWTQPGPCEVEGYAVFYSSNSDPRQQKGVLIAIRQKGAPEGSLPYAHGSVGGEDPRSAGEVHGA